MLTRTLSDELRSISAEERSAAAAAAATTSSQQLARV